MSDEANKVDSLLIDPPEQTGLPQGAEEFLTAHKELFDALFELHAPFLNVHPGIHGNYAQACRLLKEVGFYVNDSLNMILHPELFKVPGAEGGKDAASENK